MHHQFDHSEKGTVSVINDDESNELTFMVDGIAENALKAKADAVGWDSARREITDNIVKGKYYLIEEKTEIV